MKKILITFVLSIIGFIGFSSALLISEDLSFGPGTKYYIYNDNYTYSIVPQGDYGDTTINLRGSFIRNGSTSNKKIKNCGLGCTISSSDWVNTTYGGNYDSLYLYGDSAGGPYLYKLSYDNGQSEIVLEGGTDNLSPAVSSIFSVITELIPYVVYISIGVLLFTFGFVAVRWLVNWFTDKFKGYFK